jgi:hypothetical protein
VVGLVSVHSGQEWSPWFRLLRRDWPENDLGQVAHASGRVEVDVLRLANRSRELKYRVDWRTDQKECRLRRVALCLEGESPLPRSAHTAPAPLLLEVPFLSQWDAKAHPAARICSPTCLAMVASYYDRELSVDQLAGEAFDRDHDLYGNWSANMLALSMHGFRAVVDRGSAADELDKVLMEKRPIIASMAFENGELTGSPLDRTDGHLVVIAGVTAEGDFAVRDPAARGLDDWRVYRREQLARAWLDHGGVWYNVQPEVSR